MFATHYYSHHHKVWQNKINEHSNSYRMVKLAGNLAENLTVINILMYPHAVSAMCDVWCVCRYVHNTRREHSIPENKVSNVKYLLTFESFMDANVWKDRWVDGDLSEYVRCMCSHHSELLKSTAMFVNWLFCCFGIGMFSETMSMINLVVAVYIYQ